MAKIYRVAELKLNQLVNWQNVRMIHWLTIKAYLSVITVTKLSESFYPQDGGKYQLAIDMEQNYVTVTLCITYPTTTTITDFQKYRDTDRLTAVFSWRCSRALKVIQRHKRIVLCLHSHAIFCPRVGCLAARYICSLLWANIIGD